MALSTPDGREIKSALEEAIYLVLGGPTKACYELRVSTQAIYKLLSAGYVSSRKRAVRLEQVTGIPAAELMNLAPWGGPERSGGAPPKGGRPDETGEQTSAAGSDAPEKTPATAPAPVSAMVRSGRRVHTSARRCARRQAGYGT